MKASASLLITLSAAALPSLVCAVPASADVDVVQPTGANYVPWKPLTVGANKYNVNLISLTTVNAANMAMQDALKAQFGTWNFTYSNNSALDGSLVVSQYKAASVGTFGGGLLDTTYVLGNGDPVLANLRWIQLVVTNAPLNGAPATGYIDPVPNDDKLPFYWTTPEDSSSAVLGGRCGQYTQGGKPNNGSRYHFYDCSTRNMQTRTPPIDWTAYLVLASWTDPGGNNWLTTTPPAMDQNVTVYGGIEWGWKITAVPEPRTWALLLTGFVGIGTVGLRRRPTAA